MTTEPTDNAEAIQQGAERIAHALNRLGNADAATPMGGLEAHGKAILDSSERLAGAIEEAQQSGEPIASALDEHGKAMLTASGRIQTGLNNVAEAIREARVSHEPNRTHEKVAQHSTRD